MIQRCMWLVVLAAAVCAQPAATIVGNWQGTLDSGPQKLRLAFRITANGKGGFVSTLDSLDQNVLGIPVQETTFVDNKLHLNIKGSVQFEGTLNANAEEISGTFTQGVPRPLTLKRVDRIELPRRAQDPKPPFPYDAEDVSYENKGIHFAGTLTLPRGEGPFPAAILITGSGPQDRDETMFGHKPFWVIADNLTRRGIVVLRVDDRGMGKSTGQSTQTTLDEMADDVLAGIGYLKGRKQVDAKHIGVIGHSEGGMVGPLAAARSSDVAFVVMLAGTGASFDQAVDSHLSQAELSMRGAAVTEDAIAWNNAFQKMLFKVLRSESDPKTAVEKMRSESEKMKAALPNSQRKALNDPHAIAAENQQFASVASPEMRSLLLYEPGETLRHLKAPVLALNGSRDLQVSARLNLPAIVAALAEGGNGDFTVTALPGLNHLLQTCRTCTLAEYGEVEETFSPTALLIIGDWVVGHTRAPAK